MKLETPEDYGEYKMYDFDNRITYDEDSDSMYIYVAPPQGQVGSVLVYQDEGNLVTIDTDEVNTQVGIEILGLSKLMKKFNTNKIKNN
jgi:uncharacterized protein YuzE